MKEGIVVIAQMNILIAIAIKYNSLQNLSNNMTYFIET